MRHSKSFIFFITIFILLTATTKSYSQKKPNENPSKISGTISLNITTKSPTCSDAIGVGGYVYGNGIINMVASGGTPPYIYSSNSTASPQNNGYFPGLSEGPYFLRATDANGQFTDTAITLANTLPQALCDVSVNKLPTSCTSADGSFTIVELGGTSPFTYSIDGGITFTSNNTFNNLTQGYYLVYIKDANGCMGVGGTQYFDPYNFFCTQCCNLQIVPGGSETACSNDGKIITFAINGSPPYQYSLDGINFQTGVYSSNYTYDPYEVTFPNLVAGVYHIYVKDNTGALSVAGYTLSKSCYVNITFVSVDASCQANNGSLTVNATFGTPPYSYTIDGLNFQTSNIFSGLSAGTYSVTVTDAHGETYSKQATVFDKCPTITATETDETCSQKNGTITATGNKGTTPYQFSIDGVNFQTGNIFSGLSAGNYTVTIKDAGGFTSTTSIAVNNNCLQLTLNIINTTCSNKNGSITTTGSNGTAPYRYSIDGINFQNNNVFDTLTAGNYTITVKDANGLTKDSTITVTDAPAAKISVAVTDASCSNTNGSLNITTSGGTPPLQYSINNGVTYQVNNIFNNLDSGQYISLVKDANGCITKNMVQVTAPPNPKVFLGNDTTICNGQTLLLTTPQLVNYQYLWQDNSISNSYLVNNPGNYSVKVTNQFNCSVSDSITIAYRALPVFYLGNDTSICNRQSLLLQPVPLAQGNYLWNTGNTSSSLNINSGGLYWLQVSDSGCVKSDSISITYKSNPVINIGNDTTLCTGSTLTLNAVNNNATYLWQDGSTQPTFIVTNPGAYSVTVSLNGCDTSGGININYLSKPILNLGPDTTLCMTENLLLDVTYPQSTYLWQDGSQLAHYDVTQAGTYSVGVTNTCGTTNASINVTYENCACKFYVPTAFSPNGDGKNDLFKPGYECLFSNYEMKIYNRWGQLVFASQNASMGWDGNYKNEQQPVDIYIWVMEYKDNLTGKDIRKNGVVMLIR
jgi:gliding motility-associated-like protein